MILRKAVMDDLPLIKEIIDQARFYLKENGVDQWQDGYPSECDITELMNLQLKETQVLQA